MSGSKTFILYHTNWSTYGRNFQVKDLPIDFIPNLAYAFADLRPNGEIVLGDPYADIDKRFSDGVPPQDSWNDAPDPKVFYGNLGQFMKLKKAGKRFGLQLAVGGWTWSRHFSDAVSTLENRNRFVKTLIDLFKRYPVFDGVSIDWEYISGDAKNYGAPGNSVRKEDPQNFAEFLQILRQELAKNGMGHYTISLCVTPAPEKLTFPIGPISALLDQVHVMTYDFAGGEFGDTVAAHQANLMPSPSGPWSVVRAVETYLAQGVDSRKLFIGAVLYSRGFSNTLGIGQPAAGPSPDMSWETGIVDYKALPRPGATEIWDPQAKATYSYDPAKKVLNSYDSVQSIREKCKFVWERNLGGLICWESSGDVPITDPRSIIRAMHDGLVKTTSPAPAKPVPAPVPAPVPPPVAKPKPKPPPIVVSPIPMAQGQQQWTPGTWCIVGQTIAFNGRSYIVLQSHRAQLDWPPNLVPALFRPSA